ncbi:MAG TPA: DUF6265 family protein [Longimicrobium sp.]|nr:DUF6265 family protein [Longimicrobium sp.]
MIIPSPIRSPIPRIVLATLALVAAVTPSAARAQEADPVSRLAFMAGCWRGDAGVDRTIEETWTAADSDVMLATTRYLDDNTGRTRGWEFSRVVADSAGITLFPAPLGREQGRFRMAPSSSAGEARFEDPEHDYPKRIIYRRMNDHTLAVQLDGGEGDREALELRLERVPCPGSTAP